MRKLPLDLAAWQIRKDMRRIVGEITGYNNHPPLLKTIPTRVGPLWLDDVAIHLRCGDILKFADGLHCPTVNCLN